MTRLLLLAALLFPAAAAASPAPDIDVRGALPDAPFSFGTGALPKRLSRIHVDRVVQAPGGLRIKRLNPEVGGIPSFDSGVTVGLDGSGRIISVAGAPTQLSVPSTTPAVDAAAALAAFARSAGLPAPADLTAPSGPQREQRFAGGFARLVIFAMPHGEDRLGWHVYLGGYDGVVDAQSGAILRRHSTVKRAAAAQVFPNFPGATVGGAATPVDLEGKGWLTAGAPTLSGPYVHAYTDLPNDDMPSAGDEVNRTAKGDFVFPFKRFSTEKDDRCIATASAPTPFCSWNSSDVPSYQDNLSNTTVQTFFLDNVWHDHLASPAIGFNQASGNFEGDDPVDAQTDDSAATYVGTPLGLISAMPGSVNNANMSTPPDGTAPTMQMYLGAFDDVTLLGLFRDYNNGDDAATVFHEYTHGLSSRLVINADGSEAVDSDQAGAMGEDWSDWYAFDFLVRLGLSPDTAANSEVDIGIYSDAAPHATRSQGLDCPVGATGPECPGAQNAGAGGYTYGDFGKIADGPEVHADGEIWGETLWDLRTALVASEGGQAAGSDVAEAIVTGGMRLSPPEPSFIAERDAIMAADVAIYGGRHMPILWKVFAARGMGTDASSTGGTDDAPVEGFKEPTPVTLKGTLKATPTKVKAGKSVAFDASSFAGASSALKGYSWDFDGDGKVDQSTVAPTTSHVYRAGGAFTAKVAVNDVALGSGAASARVKVTGAKARLTIAKTGTVGVRCGRCTAKVRTSIAKRAARKLGVRRTTRRRAAVKGKRTLRLRISAKARRRGKAHGLRSVRVVVRVSAGGAKKSRAVRIRL